MVASPATIAAAAIPHPETRLRDDAAPVCDGLAALFVPAPALDVGSTKTVVSAVTTRGVAMLLAKTLEADDEPEDDKDDAVVLDRVAGREAFATVPVEL